MPLIKQLSLALSYLVHTLHPTHSLMCLQLSSTASRVCSASDDEEAVDLVINATLDMVVLGYHELAAHLLKQLFELFPPSLTASSSWDKPELNFVEQIWAAGHFAPWKGWEAAPGWYHDQRNAGRDRLCPPFEGKGEDAPREAVWQMIEAKIAHEDEPEDLDLHWNYVVALLRRTPHGRNVGTLVLPPRAQEIEGLHLLRVYVECLRDGLEDSTLDPVLHSRRITILQKRLSTALTLIYEIAFKHSEDPIASDAIKLITKRIAQGHTSQYKLFAGNAYTACFLHSPERHKVAELNLIAYEDVWRIGCKIVTAMMYRWTADPARRPLPPLSVPRGLPMITLIGKLETKLSFPLRKGAATLAQVEAAEARLRCSFPGDYVEFLKTSNGLDEMGVEMLELLSTDGLRVVSDEDQGIIIGSCLTPHSKRPVQMNVVLRPTISDSDSSIEEQDDSGSGSEEGSSGWELCIGEQIWEDFRLFMEELVLNVTDDAMDQQLFPILKV